MKESGIHCVAAVGAKQQRTRTQSVKYVPQSNAKVFAEEIQLT